MERLAVSLAQLGACDVGLDRGVPVVFGARQCAATLYDRPIERRRGHNRRASHAILQAFYWRFSFVEGVVEQRRKADIDAVEGALIGGDVLPGQTTLNI